MEADYIRACMKLSREPLPKKLDGTINDWNELQIWERLLGLTGKNTAETPARFAKNIKLETLEQQQTKLEKSVRDTTDSFFRDVILSPETASSPIVWKN